MAQFALAWVIHQPGITSAIIGPRTHEQLEDNLGALDLDITAEDRQLVDELAPPGSMVSPFYQADFGPGPFRWYFIPRGAPNPLGWTKTVEANTVLVGQSPQLRP